MSLMLQAILNTRVLNLDSFFEKSQIKACSRGMRNDSTAASQSHLAKLLPRNGIDWLVHSI